MSALAKVRVTVTVAVEPDMAFRVFTEDFDEWYRTGSVALGPHRRHGGTLHFEPGPDGRLVERRPDGRDIERACITTWEPGERLVFVDRRHTEVEVLFEAVPEGTRVVLEHRGLDRLPPGQAADIAKYGWRRLADWFESHLAERTHP